MRFSSIPQYQSRSAKARLHSRISGYSPIFGCKGNRLNIDGEKEKKILKKKKGDTRGKGLGFSPKIE